LKPFISPHIILLTLKEGADGLYSLMSEANKSKPHATNWGGYVLKLLKQVP
jgi:hypothetical protein